MKGYGTIREYDSGYVSGYDSPRSHLLPFEATQHNKNRQAERCSHFIAICIRMCVLVYVPKCGSYRYTKIYLHIRIFFASFESPTVSPPFLSSSQILLGRPHCGVCFCAKEMAVKTVMPWRAAPKFSWTYIHQPRSSSR